MPSGGRQDKVPVMGKGKAAVVPEAADDGVGKGIEHKACDKPEQGQIDHQAAEFFIHDINSFVCDLVKDAKKNLFSYSMTLGTGKLVYEEGLGFVLTGVAGHAAGKLFLCNDSRDGMFRGLGRNFQHFRAKIEFFFLDENAFALEIALGKNVGFSQKACHKVTVWMEIDFLWGVALEALSTVKDGDAVGKTQGFLLVVGDKDGGDAQLLLDGTDFCPHFFPERYV